MKVQLQKLQIQIRMEAKKARRDWWELQGVPWGSNAEDSKTHKYKKHPNKYYLLTIINGIFIDIFVVIILFLDGC